MQNFFDIFEKNIEIVKKKIDNDIISNFAKQYTCLVKLISKNGKFNDPYLRSSLNFQYHYTFIILASILFYRIGFKVQSKKIYNLIKYWSNIPEIITQPSLEFNNFALCLSCAILKSTKNQLIEMNKIKIFLENKIKHLKHKIYKELIPLNNNFIALTAFNQYLHGNLINNETKSENGISLMKSKIINFQMDDGFFPDTNMGEDHLLEKNKGISHLTYHSKISMLVTFLGIISENQEMQKVALKGIDNVIELVSYQGESCFYGRSQNALFGYACLFLGLNLIYKFVNSDQKYLDLSYKILKLIENYQLPNGYFAINLNKNMKERPGFDSYMYSVVYNAYSNAIFLMGIIINPEILKNLIFQV